MAIEISTTQFIKTVDAVIDGTPYKVRRLGAGESLDASQLLSKIAELQPKMAELGEKYENAKGEGEKHKYSTQLMQLSAQISGINRQIEDIYSRAFDDGGDGQKAHELVAMLGVQQVPALIEAVFKEA